MEKIYNSLLFKNDMLISNEKTLYDKNTIKKLKERKYETYTVKDYEEGRLDIIIYRYYGKFDYNLKYIIKVLNNITDEFSQIKAGMVLSMPDSDVEGYIYSVV